MTARELQKLLQSGQPPLLIQVLPPEVCAAEHIPGSQNACVYEMTFADQVKELGASPSAPVIVYGAGAGSLDSAAAVEKLRETGYTQVQSFDGGLAEWKAAGLPLAGYGNLPSPPVPDGTYKLEANQSLIRWTGRNLFNSHYGTVKLCSGEAVLRQGQLVSARFTVDMNTIACDDLTDGKMNAMLIAHLHSGDFFDVPHHPTAEFTAAAAEKIEACTDGTPNCLLLGTFTLRGVTKPLSFPIVFAPSDDAQQLTAQGQFELDRTEFGSYYGSGKLFRFLGKHLVNDHIHLHVKIVATRAPVEGAAS